MQIPVSINGLGTTQAAFAALFVPQGTPAAPVFALSVLFLALGIVGTLPGGLLYAFDQGQARVNPGSDEGQTGARPGPDRGQTRVRPLGEGDDGSQG
jgi:hypothetical protein